MADEEKSFFDKLNDILNTPLPGTAPDPADIPEKQAKTEDDDGYTGIVDRVREILNTPLPGVVKDAQEAEVRADDAEAPADADEVEDLADDWWDEDWAAFRAHQQEEREALNSKQRHDSELFARYQEDERRRFDEAAQYDFEVFKAEQQRKLDMWTRQMQSGGNGHFPPPPPPPHRMPPPPPWARLRPRKR